MRWLITLLTRAALRVRAHRNEALAFFGFVGLLTLGVRMAGVGSVVVGWLDDRAGGGLPAAVVVAMTMAWLPLMVIDMRRCTRETTLRKHVQADLEARQQAEEAARVARETAHAEISAVLATGGPRLVYQPIVNLVGGGVVGFEALSRFDGGGCPAEWFTRAASVGLGTDLELAAVRSALGDLHRLPAGTYLSVNVGPDTLADARLADLVRAAPGCRRIVLELTEHSAVADYEPCRSAMAELRKYGVRLAVDDAGAGYASLRHVLDLTPDIIKVDRSLVQGIDVDPGRRSLFVALVTFASDLGAGLVAEGVESAAEARQLRTWGVRFAQGWYYGRPRPLVDPPIESATTVQRANAALV